MKTKKFSLMILLLSSGLVSNAQEAYMDTIAQKTCECISKKQEETKQLTSEELGVCLFQVARDYQAELKEDFDFDLENLADGEGERLGELIGTRMAFTCPEILMSAAGDMEEEEPAFSAKGTVTGVISEPFVVFEVKQDNGRIGKFYWLSFVDTDLALQDSFEELKTQDVEIEFVGREIFDPRIREYKMFNVITSIKLRDTQ